MQPSHLNDIKVPVRLKLSALWASVLFCYIYGDFFGLYQPGNLQSMLDGRMGSIGPTTQGILLVTAALMSVPSLMVSLSLILPPRQCRWLNILLGIAYTLLAATSLPGTWAFYIVLTLIEITLTLTIAVLAWRWHMPVRPT